MGTVRYTVVDGEVIAEKRAGVRKTYVPDPLGSTVALLDNTQTQTDWHCKEYHQNPDTCQCFGPYRRFRGCIPPPAPTTC